MSKFGNGIISKAKKKLNKKGGNRSTDLVNLEKRRKDSKVSNEIG